jgi:hypothetical protein
VEDFPLEVDEPYKVAAAGRVVDGKVDKDFKTV